MMPPCRIPGWPSNVSGTDGRLTTEPSGASRNSRRSPDSLASPQPKQRFCAEWDRGVRFFSEWLIIFELPAEWPETSAKLHGQNFTGKTSRPGFPPEGTMPIRGSVLIRAILRKRCRIRSIRSRLLGRSGSPPVNRRLRCANCLAKHHEASMSFAMVPSTPYGKLNSF